MTLKIITCSRYNIEVLLVPIIPSKYVCFLIFDRGKNSAYSFNSYCICWNYAWISKNVYCECTPFICSHNHHHCHHSFDFQLTEDSEVFQEGTIGKDLSGGNLTTYKELCSLANEMGQLDLIYKFMDLANYQASLNSKRGCRLWILQDCKAGWRGTSATFKVLDSQARSVSVWPW
jgi:hypothetical protein